MKTTLYLTLTLFTFVTLAFLPESFAQDTSPEYVVRIIYFLPKDRTMQPDIDAKLNEMIKSVQQFFEDEMEAHRYGRKTFRFEADENGDAIVHHVSGKFNDAHYQDNTTGKVFEEIQDTFSQAKNIDFLAIDVSGGFIYLSGGEEVYGVGGGWPDGGYAAVPTDCACYGFSVHAHELGHAFGLHHDFRNNVYIMSYGGGKRELSSCSAEWLDAHRYFNPTQTPNNNSNTTVNMLPPEFSHPFSIRLRFEITDSDGLRQAQLLSPASEQDVPENAPRTPKIIDCKKLNDATETVEFVTNKLPVESETQIWLRIMDKNGNYTGQWFTIDVASLLPQGDVVSIPDANLAAAVRESLGLAPTSDITQLDMLKLTKVVARKQQITDLTGLEQAVNLISAFLEDNQIQDITPLTELTSLKVLAIGNNKISNIPSFAGAPLLGSLNLNNNLIRDLTPFAQMTQLKSLVLNSNPIKDITPLTTLTQLDTLFLDDTGINDLTPLIALTGLQTLLLRRNGISDITPIAKMPQLRYLILNSNEISDITPIAKLTKLATLELRNNQIQDISPLTGLASLARLYLGDNQITDISPLAKIPRLETIYLPNNQISDVTLFAEMVNLKYVVLHGNPIKDRKPLLELLRKNPRVEIFDKRGRGPLPVTLSSFRAEHTNAGVVLKWTTESELDNAGFNILRSETKDGTFKVVNPKLIHGAGTTGERQTYTWTDTTAKPNVVYYYRIEDVSHAGTRKQLATVRLRGLVSATGKLTTSWADLKTPR